MAVKCPECHSENSPTARFCAECGAALALSGPQSQPKPLSVTETVQTPVHELTTGATFAGRYQVIEELGRGGMGKVYKVFDIKVKEKVALKLIKPEIASDRETIERFSNELKLARKIRHKNVCGMFDIGEAGGAHFITMEYVGGEDLKSMIRMTGTLGVGTVLSVGKQICDGLMEAHAQGVVHRDLKPTNIMIDRGGNAKIMDFGIARSIREKGITGPNVLIGTPEYMSPEQAEAKEVDSRSDIYSLGIILYEMSAGRVPFEGDTALSIAMRHKGEAPKNPKQFNPHIPDDLAGVILKCLEKDRFRRYQAAADVRAELERIEKGLPTTERVAPERKPSTAKQITVTFQLKKLVVPAVAIVALAVIGIVLLKVIPKKAATPAAPSNRSIAVLPFENLGDPGEDEAFTSGMTEDITTQLSRIGELDVRSQTSAMRYKDSSLGIREIGQELNVHYVLDGSVRRAGGTVRISARLIDAATDKNIWAETFDRDLKEIFAIQSDIARQIASALQAKLTPAEKERIEREPTRNIRAYEYYVKGREYYYRYNKEDNEQAIVLFKKAVEVDPRYALAHAGLADAYFQRFGRFRFPAADWFDLAVEQAQKAISLDPDLPEGYKALGSLYGFGKGWWRKAVEAGQKAVEADPKNVLANLVQGEAYLNLGEPDRALPFIKKAVALSPAWAFPYQDMGYIYQALDDPVRAEEWFKKALALQPDLDTVHFGLSSLYVDLGEYGQAIDQSRTFLAKFPDNLFLILGAARAELFSGHHEKAKEHYQKFGKQIIEFGYGKGGPAVELGYIYWQAGRRDEAGKLFQDSFDWLNKLLEQGDESSDNRVSMAALNAVQGNKEEALRWLQKAADAGWLHYHYASRYPLFENIRDDERFKRILDETKAKVAGMRRRVEQLERDNSK